MLSILPRNSKQIANIQQREHKKFRITHDAIYNLHELAFNLEDFVKEIVTYPNLIVVCG